MISWPVILYRRWCFFPPSKKETVAKAPFGRKKGTRAHNKQFLLTVARAPVTGEKPKPKGPQGRAQLTWSFFLRFRFPRQGRVDMFVGLPEFALLMTCGTGRIPLGLFLQLKGLKVFTRCSGPVLLDSRSDRKRDFPPLIDRPQDGLSRTAIRPRLM
ncbi:hypothetical protein BDN72DRAFT_192551 [Pluteus cervinus]|uniref:Uncharacterized protein n=1 Tax=Pluteus cervinus TaxID=181527 RepID=A0ACD3AI80_9AGAR|nr:hypothetical protein BDN72DRAFT_192551 [Pluteus cervinus]